MTDTTTVIVAGARTPMGRLLGSLKDLSGSDLGGIAIKGALDKSGVAPEQVDYVIMGQVLTAGAGQMPARQAAVAAGIPMNVPALSINKVCLSGIDAIALADQLIRAGEFDIVVAGGQESMSRAPHMLEKSREGFKYGDVTLRDHMAYDGLHDIFTDQAMGLLTEQVNQQETAHITRAEQDAFAAASHQNAARAWKDGLFDNEVVPVSIPQRKGEPIVFAQDEGIRADTTTESLGKLRPAFSKDGTITAGSASPISDGAAAVVLTAERARVRVAGIGQGAEALAVRQRPSLTSFRATQAAAKAAFAMAGFPPARVDFAEIHDAFAPFELISLEDLGLLPPGTSGRATLDGETALDGRLPVNPSGGLKARGHPLAGTGLAQIVECVWQLTGVAEGRQLDGRVALAHSIGGLATNNWVTLLEAA